MRNSKNTWVIEGDTDHMPQDVNEKRLFTYKAFHEEIDTVNLRILEELQRDPRVTMSELGAPRRDVVACCDRTRPSPGGSWCDSRILSGSESNSTWVANCGLRPHPSESWATAQDCRTGAADS
jgi:hypothetical protein